MQNFDKVFESNPPQYDCQTQGSVRIAFNNYDPAFDTEIFIGIFGEMGGEAWVRVDTETAVKIRNHLNYLIYNSYDS